MVGKILAALFLPYVINGVQVTEFNSPVVRVELVRADGYSYYCSGSLVASKKVLTAAHCIRPYGSNPVRAIAAIVNIDGVVHSSDNFRLHPRWQPVRGFDHDLAIITLSEPVAANIPRLKVDTKKAKTGKPYLVMGYGYYNGFTDPNVLRMGSVVFDWMTKEMLVNVLRTGESTACFGDSGGPVLSDKGIIGVVTAGEYACDRIGSQSIYARMSNKHNLSFIKKYGK